jgi:hypothetical protein
MSPKASKRPGATSPAAAKRLKPALPLRVLPWVKAAIEGELREYPVSCIILREMKQDIIDSTPIHPAPKYMTASVLKDLRDRVIPAESTLRTSLTDPHPSARNNRVSDPTYAKVARMDTGLIRRIETWSRAIEEVYYNVLDDEQRTIVRLFYWVGVRHYALADYLHMNESTVWRMRQDIIWLIAYRMGMLGENPLNLNPPRADVVGNGQGIPQKPTQPAPKLQGSDGKTVVGL